MSIKLDDIQSMSVADLAACSGEELARLMRDAEKAMNQLSIQKQWLESVVAYKYVYQATQIRSQLEQDFGTVSFEDDGVRVLADLPREVSWDQKKLSAIAECIRTQGEDPAEFLDIQYHVPEERFDYWPETIQRAFEAAFSIKSGSPSYRLVALNKEVTK
ncbi:MAG: hypothetical protein ACR2PX_22790 [Endozoicomonas sp.]|uniref:hypothetical protein n=1 Tax=Endozoicomonas sp. TaxID=1892382 RepID=UPI003D9B134B